MFESVNIKAYKGITDSRFLDKAVSVISVVNDRSGVVIKKTPKTLVVEIPIDGSGFSGIIAKVHYYSLLSGIRRRSKSQKALQAYKALNAIGINAARPVAILDKRVFGILRESWYLAEKIPDAEGIDWYIKRWFSGQDEECLERKERLIYDLARLIAKLHKHGIYHNDLKASNILVQGNGLSSKLLLIDLESIDISGNVNDRRRKKNLVQITSSLHNLLTKSDIEGFFTVYCKEFGVNEVYTANG